MCPVADLDENLQQLAEAYGIACDYWDWQGGHVIVQRETVVAVLAGLGVDAGTEQATRAALEDHRLADWRRTLPPFRAIVQGKPAQVEVHVPAGAGVEVVAELETGGTRRLQQLENWNPDRENDGRWTGEASFELPADLPLGYHRVVARVDGAEDDQSAEMTLVVSPAWLGLPPALGDRRGWGLGTQLYSVTSQQSWGTGDLVDLADLAVWSAAEHGADYVLINPLHAAEPVPPLEPSPYLPSSRRFANPLYLRPEQIPEYATAEVAVRAQVARRLTVLRAELAEAAGAGDEQIDRDSSWLAKRAALRLIFDVERTPGREVAFAGYRARQGQGLLDFAAWSVLAEEFGPAFRSWPEPYQHPESPAVADYVAQHRTDIDFVCWLQWVLDEQLAHSQQAARRAGMALGIMHDLAVGVSPEGADAWCLQETYAQGITVGAPPDPYNQNGQDWSQPPWRPDRLAASGYAPYRELVANVLRNAGGLRVDHVIGLFRLWWIPAGAGPKNGTYVRYDHEAMIGILALEAHRAGAVVVGEDLGTVEPWVRTYLAERGILGTSILWFEFDFDHGGAPLAPERWREYCLASVTTHDLPPTAGYLVGDHVRLRDQLGVLTRPLADELAVDEAERKAWLDNLIARGGLTEGADVEETVLALHRYLTWTPSRLLCVALTDAVGERQTQNQPGTIDEYPNWRVPLRDADGNRISLEQIFTGQRASRLADLVRSGLEPQG